MSNLPGILYDKQAQSDIDLQCQYHRTWRAYYIALHYMHIKKYKESAAFCFRVETYLKQLESSLVAAMKPKSGSELDVELLRRFDEQLKQLRGEVNQCKYKLQTSMIMEDESSGGALGDEKDAKERDAEREKLEKIPLSERPDIYFDDAKATTNVVNTALPFEPIACKPLFFDLALNYVELPSYEDKIDAKKQQPAAGVKGFIKGWLGF